MLNTSQQFVCAVANHGNLCPNRGRGVIPSASVFSSPSVRDNGNFAEGYRLPTVSPYPKTRRDINQALVTISQSDPRFSEMRSFAEREVFPGNEWVVDPMVVSRLRPGSNVAGRKVKRSQHNELSGSE